MHIVGLNPKPCCWQANFLPHCHIITSTSPRLCVPQVNDLNASFSVFQICVCACVWEHTYNKRHIFSTYISGKSWLLKVISPEEHERNFIIEIIQDKLSSSSRKFIWNHFSVYGDSYIKHFHLKTYEEGEITSLKLHFFHEILKITEVKLCF